MGVQDAFVITQVGDKGSLERKRADEITDYVISPVLHEHSLILQRADRDPTPGQITPQLLRNLLEARVIIADLTGRNANVYYELGVAHSFARPVITMVDSARNVAFDTKDERLIELGSYEGVLAVPQAEEAKRGLHEALSVVLDEGYAPSSLVAEVATARSIDDLAPENPLASEIAYIKDAVEELRHGRQQLATDATDFLALRGFVERLARSNKLDAAEIGKLVTQETTTSHDAWVDDLQRIAEGAAPPPSQPPEPEDVPF